METTALEMRDEHVTSPPYFAALMAAAITSKIKDLVGSCWVYLVPMDPLIQVGHRWHLGPSGTGSSETWQRLSQVVGWK